MACGNLVRRPANANIRTVLLSCANISILRVGDACRHNLICKASIFGWVSEERTLMGLV